MTFAPSTYQQNFFDFVANGRGSCILVAVAGAGKTTSVVKALSFIPRGSAQLLAFNTTIAKELQERILEEKLDPQRFSAKTFHSLGNGAVFKFLKNKRVYAKKPDSGKVRSIMRGMFGEDVIEVYGDFATRLVGLAKGEGIGPLVPDTMDAWYSIVSHHDLTLDSDGADETTGIEIARKLLAASNESAKLGEMDFDDMLYLPLLWKLKLWQNEWVFIDEAQDTNPVRRALAKLALKPGGRLVAVGDPNPAIYGFTGASHDSLDLIRREFIAIELPLTVSYRCAKAIVRQAQEVVSHIEAFEGAEEGVVETLPIAKALESLVPGDAILCRNVAPLVTLAYRLIGEGRGVKMVGRDIGAGLVSLIKKAKAKSIDSLETKLTEWRERETAKHLAKGEEQKAEAINDRVESIFAVIANLSLNDRTIPALIKSIEGMFDDNANGVLVLSSIHKAKGREWNTVAVLRQDLSPSKWARQDWQFQQEMNLIYVRDTRAKSRLVFMTEAPKK